MDEISMKQLIEDASKLLDEEIIKEGQQAEIIKVEGNTVKIKSV